jgi:hypothetical protein
VSYSDIIKDAFWIAWRNRFTWFFGFFLSGAAGSFAYPTNFGNFGVSGEDVSTGGAPPWLLNLGHWIQENVVLFLVIVVGFVLSAVSIWLALFTISRGALAESVAAIERGETRRFSSTWRAGIRYFWRVLGQITIIFLIWVGITLVICLLGGLMAVGTFAATDSVAIRVLVVALEVILFLPVLIAFFVSLTIVGQFALRALVVGGEGVFASIESGYRLFRHNLGRSLLLLLIQISIALGAGGTIFVSLTITGLLLSVPVTLLISSGQNVVSTVVAVALSLIFSIPFIVITSAIGVFHQAYWTLAYLRLTRPTQPPAPTDSYGTPGTG